MSKNPVRSGPTPEARVAEPNADHESRRESAFAKRIREHRLVHVDWTYALAEPDTAAMIVGPRRLDRKDYGVSWSSIGMVSPENAVEFANAVLHAADLARIMNEQEATEPHKPGRIV